MADDFALGNALMTFGQTGGNAVNQYFNEQIGAAQHAQEQTLNMLKFKAEQDDKLATRTETARHNAADEANTSARNQSEDLYHQGELENAQTRNANEAKYQQGELGIRGGELADKQRNTTSEISHRTAEEQEADARIAAEADKAKRAGGDAADKSADELRTKQVTNIDEQIKKLNPDGVDVKMLTPDKQQSVAALQKQREALAQGQAHARAGEAAAGKLNAPMVNPNDPDAGGQSAGFGHAIMKESTDIAPAKNPAGDKGKAAGDKGKATPKLDLSTVPSTSLNLLKSNPSTAMKMQFDQRYGQGAAEQALGE